MKHRTFFPQPQKPKQNKFWKVIKLTTIYSVYLGIIVSIGIAGYLYHLSRNLPELTNLINPIYDLPTQVYDRHGQLIEEIYTKRRVLIPIKKVPPVLIQALLSIEDARFYHHFGIDPIRMVKALIVNVSQMRIAQGASTLTQQTARLFLLSNEKKMVRKLKEILLALKIERLFTKDQILELYINKYFLGHRAYGFEAASQGYFNKTVTELTLAEAALLAGLPQAPSKWSPTYSITNAKRRRNQVLQRMADEGYITREQKMEAMDEPIVLKLNENIDNNETSYYLEHVRRYLLKKYGVDMLYRGGLKVYVNMDLQKQIYAQHALTQGLIDHDKRQGYRGPIQNLFEEVNNELDLSIYTEEDGWDENGFQNLDEDTQTHALTLLENKRINITSDNRYVIGGTVLGVVEKVTKKTTEVNLGEYIGNLNIESMEWARPVDYTKSYTRWTRLRDINDILDVGDVIMLNITDYQQNAKEFVLELTQKPVANGSIFVMDPRNGEVIAMSGGFDFRDSEFNRATQSKRQPGSAFKPIVYANALDSSFTPASILDDSPLVFPNTDWKPINFDKKFKGKMSLRDCLVFSRNVPTVRLTMSLGIEAIIEYAQKLGISAKLPENYTIGLGSASLTLEEMVRTYAIFANSGHLIDPIYIQRVEDRQGEILEQSAKTFTKSVLTNDTAFLMNNLLEDVVRRGTGQKAKVINRPSAGKTGTTNDYTDAWYMGYVPQLIAGVYLGFDDIRKTLGYYETGSRAAAPIWVDFMKHATATLPVLPFQQPENIQMVRINSKTGLKACNGGRETKYEFFKVDSEPTQCHRESMPLSIPELNEGSDALESETVIEEL